MCELKWCQSGNDGKIRVGEVIGDGTWCVLICQDCADKLGMTEDQVLPDPDTVKKALTKSL